MAPLKVLVIGCGIAGRTLATFLLLSDLPAAQKPYITILERSSAIRTQGQNVDIRGVGITIIRKLGLEKVIRASTVDEEGVRWVDSNNRVWAAFPLDRRGKLSTPTADIEIMRGTLAKIEYERSKQVSEDVRREGGAGIDYIFGDYLDKIQHDGDHVDVHFAKSRQTRSFDLVIGADGLQSLTRTMVWGAKGSKDTVKRLHVYGAFFSMPRGKTDDQWRRWFHADRRRGIMMRPHEQ